MMKLIDADVLTQKFEELKSGQGLKDTLFLCGVQAVIDAAPTVETIRCGEWTNGYFQDIVCTACLHPSPINKKTLYCPNCGVKMK
jgi:hypothetical protein